MKGGGLTEGAFEASGGEPGSGPGERLVLFHDRLAEGCIEDIGELFSFTSAWEYWRDIAVSLGLPVPQEAEFRAMVESLLSSSLVRDAVVSCRIRPVKVKTVGSVASVVFERSGGQGGRVVATLVNEGGSWKVRTYPGVFPGELLSLRNAARRPQRERFLE